MKGFKIWLVLASWTILFAQDTSDLTKESYHFDVSGISRMDVEISYGLGELIIKSSQDANTIEGFIKYNSKYVTPDVDYHKIGSKGKLDITVKSHKRGDDEDHWPFDFRGGKRHGDSEVDFRLPQSIPMDIKMDFGLGDADLDFSTLSISDLHMDFGLSDVKISMDKSNPVTCRRISIQSGLGDFNASELGNLRPREFHLDVGLGSASIDLTGDITNDMEGDIKVGLGSLDLILPKNVNIRLEVEETFLSSVDVEGLVKENNEWVSRHWDRQIPTIELEISVGLGSVDVEVK